MSSAGILSYGVHIPRKRIPRASIFAAVGWAQPGLKGLAKGARAYASWDEDAITMAVEAARDALAGSGLVPAELCFASTTAPFLDRLNAGVIATALDLPGETHCHDAAGSQRAAVSSLLTLSKSASPALLVAADRRSAKPASTSEMLFADGAAALLVGEGRPIAQSLGAATGFADFVDHYRTAASGFDYVLEERWVREVGLSSFISDVAVPLLHAMDTNAESIAHFIAPTVNPALARGLGEAMGIRKEAVSDSLFDACGHTGVAHPILMLANVLDRAKPGELILLTAFGQGCDAILLRVTDALDEARKAVPVSRHLSRGFSDENYARFLSAAGNLDIDWGMRAERDNRTAQTVAFNKSRDVYGFVGGLCGTCETPQFPKTRRCVNPDCGALDTQSDYRFAERHAQVKSFTEDWLAFTRDPPLIYGNVSFEGGGNVFMEMTGFSPGAIRIGAPLQMQFRIKDIDTMRGFHRYFWKAAPVEGDAHG